MRAVSFTGLHRLLNAVDGVPGGLRAKEVNALVLEHGVTLTPRGSPPKPTTLYHYRNTLLRLGALRRDGRRLRANADDPDVCALLRRPAPASGEVLSDAARDHFAALVVRNDQCRTLFFDLFMPAGVRCASVSDFREQGVSVEWARHRSRPAPTPRGATPRRSSRSPAGSTAYGRKRRGSAVAAERPHRAPWRAPATDVVLRNRATGRTARCTSRTSVAAVLYGLRYWARDELRLIDEYGAVTGATTMFPLSRRDPSTAEVAPAVQDTIRFVLSLRAPGEWAFFSVHDLIAQCCEERRQPISVLFEAIDNLLREWPQHVVLTPTSRGLATLTAANPQQELLLLRAYYRHANGPYISHFRIHQDVTAEPWEPTSRHDQYPSEAPA